MEYGSLLNLLWRVGFLTGRQIAGTEGEVVEVICGGEPSDSKCVWLAAEVVVDGERRRGNVVVGSAAEVPDGTILRVVECPTTGVLDRLSHSEKLVSQVVFDIPTHLVEWYEGLRAGAVSKGAADPKGVVASKNCANRIAAMDSLRRAELLTALLVRRLQRKTERVTALFENVQKDWNQTFHALLLQSMGGNRNREAFTELANRVTSVMISREKGRPQSALTLLLGGAGFLRPDDDRADEFRHLAAKYSISPLKLGQWDLAKLYPVNHPVSRLTQIAALLCKKDFMLDGMLECRTAEDVERLFTLPKVPVGERLSDSAASIGRAKAHLVGINMVAPLMFAYGRENAVEELCDRALDLLASIPAERNTKLEKWYSGGATAESAFDSQALLELDTEFCEPVACDECRICRGEIRGEIKKLL